MISSTRISSLVLLCLLTGCSWMPFVGGDDNEPRGPKIADVVADLPGLELPKAVAARPTQEEVLAAYERVYGLIPDSLENHAVGKRLADLKMNVGEELDIAGDEAPYAAAVDLYESLLANTEGEGRDEILYQLSRAHDLVGETDTSIDYLNRLIAGYPDSQYIVEARFRRAEIEFSRERFREAARDYRFVVQLGDASPYWQNSLYMMGWAEFKLGDIDLSLASFFAVIDNLLIDASRQSLETAQLTQQEILEDSLRVIVLGLGYLDGAQTLAEEMRRLDRPGWQYLVYQQLADSYLNDERYLDSVATWQTFIEQNGLDPRAPAAHIGMIDTLVSADFPSEIRPKKEEFVTRYGINSSFWGVHDDEVRAGYLPTLKEYLSELAKLAHAEAQESDKRGDYLLAADWYEQIVATFPNDPSIAEHYFLLGEVYTEAQEHGRAVAAFQTVVHEHPNFAQAPEAGYAAILALEELVISAPDGELELWQRLKIDAQIEFAMFFSADERAPAVQAAAADSLFALGEYEVAVELAENLRSTWTQLPDDIDKSALLILGHGYFELNDFVAAERAYQLLLTIELEEAEYDKVAERLLAAVYKQGEASEAAGDTNMAVAHYLRLRDLDPQAELAIQGQFDAVAVIEGTGQLDEAAALLTDFRSSYPDHELGRDLDKRLADMYEQTQDFSLAAAEYLRMSQSADEQDVRRQSLYRAAELYLQLDEVNNAITYFRDYANTYKKPMDLRMEAMDNLDQLYTRLDDGDKRRFWLAQKIDLQRDMGSQASERATYLAAQAQYILAEDERFKFDSVQLTHPLNKSLKNKQKSLQRSLKAFEAVASYQVAEYATAATYQIADLYAALSTAIMVSDRPADLNELELEQYEILLEEQAFPFEEQAISLHEINMRRSWDGVYDDWVKKSFTALSQLMPARFDKSELEVAYVDTIH
jgi:tetratricopeptide (TPR) repeat protein